MAILGRFLRSIDLQKSSRREAYGLRPSDYNVVKHLHVDQRQCFFQPRGKYFIRTTGFRDPTGVVMEKYHGGSIPSDRGLDHFAWINRAPGNGASKEFAAAKRAVSVIEKNDPKDLVFQTGEFCRQVVFHLAEIAQLAGIENATCQDRLGLLDDFVSGH